MAEPPPRGFMPPPQRSLPAVFMRGGTSKAIFFHRRDLPPSAGPDDRADWNTIFLAALGSPDAYGRQLDGMGGGQSSLSKIAIVAPSDRPDADVDFTFAQVGIADRSVGYKGNCGNISSAVGPFAVDEGLVSVSGDSAEVRIFNTNTSKLIVASFPLANGKACVEGDYAIHGVPGSGAPIRMSFLDPGGAVTGRLFPTGRLTEVLPLDDGRAVETSLVDAANPTVFLRASALGLTGSESPAAISDNTAAMADCEAVRIAAAVRMGIARNVAEARTAITNLPLVALVADREHAAGIGSDIVVRMLSAGLPHGATPLTGALCLAVAARIRGTLVADMLGSPVEGRPLRIGHASGTIDVDATVEGVDEQAVAKNASVYRTARRLMDGRIFFISR